MSSLILLLTITNQVYRQWRRGSSDGVSPWLFVGQITASLGFLVYSVSVENWVFTVTNALLTISAAVGCAITTSQQRHDASLAKHPPERFCVESPLDAHRHAIAFRK